ncbi:MAG TPA: type II toxin-antitoxin system HicB family antitoxin, partial [Gemmataceae bacterium]
MKLKVVFHREPDGRYSASAPALKGCYSWGATLDEARANIREAAEAWLEEMAARNPDGF